MLHQMEVLLIHVSIMTVCGSVSYAFHAGKVLLSGDHPRMCTFCLRILQYYHNINIMTNEEMSMIKIYEIVYVCIHIMNIAFSVMEIKQ